MSVEVTVEAAATEEEAAAVDEVAEAAEAATQSDQAGRGNSRETTPEPLVEEEAMTTEPLAGEKRPRDDDQQTSWIPSRRYPTGPDGAGAPPPPPPPLSLSPPPATGIAPERKSDHPRCEAVAGNASPSYATITMEDATRQMLAADWATSSASTL